MRIQYRQDDVPMDMRSKFVADLIGYKLQRDLKANEKLRALANDKSYLTKIVNVARKSKSTTGMTIDTVLQGIQTALGMEIFSFKINGLDPFKILNEQLTYKEFTVEVYMNPLYFSSEVAMSQVMPGFRKKQLDEAMITEKMTKLGKAWSFTFEKNIKEYVDMQKCVKQVLEEI
jgi:hypothetical protein